MAVKRLIIHADDAGLAQGQNAATIAALKAGMVTSYSLMVPCPWFYDMALFALDNPQYDYGIHLTLTCEWKSYKFGPVLPTEQVKSLVDSQGHFHRNRQQIKEKVVPHEAYLELKAQIDTALNLGLQPSHIDCHMYSLGVSQALIDVYIRLGQEYGLPVLLSRSLIERMIPDTGIQIPADAFTIESIHFGNYSDFKDGKLADYYHKVLANLDAGIHMILIHPAFDTPEMQQITLDHPNFGSEWRQIDFDFFTSKRCKDLIQEHRIELISWKDLH